MNIEDCILIPKKVYEERESKTITIPREEYIDLYKHELNVRIFDKISRDLLLSHRNKLDLNVIRVCIFGLESIDAKEEDDELI